MTNLESLINELKSIVRWDSERYAKLIYNNYKNEKYLNNTDKLYSIRCDKDFYSISCKARFDPKNNPLGIESSIEAKLHYLSSEKVNIIYKRTFLFRNGFLFVETYKVSGDSNYSIVYIIKENLTISSLYPDWADFLKNMFRIKEKKELKADPLKALRKTLEKYASYPI